MKVFVFTLLLFCTVISEHRNYNKLTEVFTWTEINYAWPNGVKNQANNFYTAANNIPIGVNRWRNKLFVTVPRRRTGIPSTLNFVWVNSTDRHNAPLIPYPSREDNLLENRNLISVYRIAVDPCDRLWLVDTGVLEIPGNFTRLRPNRLVIVDLKSDRIIKEYTFKQSDIKEATSLTSVTVDVTGDNCHDAYAYFPDLGGYGLVVYSLKDNNSWRIRHNYFYLEPLSGEFFIGGQRFQWPDGVFSVALSDIQEDGFRTAYFHALASTRTHSVSTRILRNRQLATRPYHGNDFKVEGKRAPNSQASSSSIHEPSGILFLGLVNQNAIACWNTNKPFSNEIFSIIHKDDQKMIYPSDVKVSGDELIVLTNAIPIFIYGQLDYSKTNFRVWTGKIADIIRGTSCEMSYYY